MIYLGGIGFLKTGGIMESGVNREVRVGVTQVNHIYFIFLEISP